MNRDAVDELVRRAPIKTKAPANPMAKRPKTFRDGAVVPYAAQAKGGGRCRELLR